MPDRPAFELQPITSVAGAAQRCWPFLAMGAAAIALQPFTHGRLDPTSYLAGIIATALGLIGALVSVLGRVREVWETLCGFICLSGIAVVVHATYGTSGGFRALILLPILWFSLHGSRRQLTAILVAATVVMTLPLAIMGERNDRYSISDLRSSLVLIGVGALFGYSSQGLRDRLSSGTRKIAVAAGELRDALEAMVDPVGRYEAVRDASGQPVDMRCVLLNAAGRNMLGGATVGELLSERLHRRGRPEMLGLWLSALDSPVPVRYEVSSQNKPDQLMMLQMVRIHNGLVVSWSDITLQRHEEKGLRKSIERWHSVAAAAADASVVLDQDLCVLHVSSSLVDMLGIDLKLALGKNVLGMVRPDDVPVVQAALMASLRDDQRRAVTFRVFDLRSPGKFLWVEGRVTGTGVDGARELNIGLRDVTADHLEREELGHQATHDGLTGLLNRAGLQHRLDSGRTSSLGTQLVYLDLDRFKPINDTHGHAAGDEVLVATARRLQATIRSNDSAARIGGDEFAVISHHIQLPADAARLVERLKAAISAPITLSNGIVVSVTASVGIAATRALSTTTVDDLLIAADNEMYRNKRQTQASVSRR